MERIKKMVDNRHEYLRELKSGGKTLVGYLCSYCPEEILVAAGLVPVRILSTEESISMSDAYMQPFYCPNSRGCLDEALRGNYAPLDGLIYPYSCEHMRCTYNSWKLHVPSGYFRFLDVPSFVETPEALHFFIQELEDFKAELEKSFTVSISKDDLQQAIIKCNENRQVLREIYALRESSPPRLSGLEAHYLNLANLLSPKEEIVDELKIVLRELKSRPAAGSNDKARLMVVGSELHNVHIMKTIESEKVSVVTDDLCVGTRNIWDDVETEGDPMVNIARRYLTRIRCPVKHPSSESRFPHIKDLITRFHVEGVIILHQKFCGPHEWQRPRLEAMLRGLNIPSTFIETDAVISEGQILARVSALKEIIKRKIEKKEVTL